jgi:acetoin utilization deacetylase AcuC-like enzyme
MKHPNKKTAIYRSPAFLGHNTGDHVENPGRMRAIDKELLHDWLLTDRVEARFGPASLDQAERVHHPRYLSALALLSEQGGGWIDNDTWCGPDSLSVAMLAAGAAATAVDEVLDGTYERAFVLCRPPGHHAVSNRGMGFCLINNIAVAAAQAIARGIERVAIVDWDVHHGNGTQEIFYESDRVLFCSVHQYGYFYPGTGATAERGRGAGDGFTINAPLPAGAGDREYLESIDELFAKAIVDFRPELILISAGFDAHEDDPLGSMRVTDAGFAQMARRVIEIAAECGHDRIVAVLEGGYDPVALGRSVAAVIRELDDVPPVHYDE